MKCPFYGIEFDASGRSVYIPSEGRVSAGDYFRFRLKTYLGREICGILSVWYGEGESSGEPDCFDVMTDESFTYDHVEDFCKVDYSRAFENQRDLFHLAFVHHNTIGRGGMTLYNGPKVIWLDDHTLQTSADNARTRDRFRSRPGTAGSKIPALSSNFRICS